MKVGDIIEFDYIGFDRTIAVDMKLKIYGVITDLKRELIYVKWFDDKHDEEVGKSISAWCYGEFWRIAK